MMFVRLRPNRIWNIKNEGFFCLWAKRAYGEHQRRVRNSDKRKRDPIQVWLCECKILRTDYIYRLDFCASYRDVVMMVLWVGLYHHGLQAQVFME